jgi:hypothetical protein
MSHSLRHRRKIEAPIETEIEGAQVAVGVLVESEDMKSATEAGFQVAEYRIDPAEFRQVIGMAGKRRHGLGLLRKKLAVTQGSAIALNVLVMNHEKLLELLSVLFAFWLQLLFGNRATRSSHAALLSDQPAAACRSALNVVGLLTSCESGSCITFSGSPTA